MDLNEEHASIIRDETEAEVAAELKAYEESAKEVALKVQRQQEGLESALLPDQFKDEEYKTVDEIQALLQKQVEENANKASAALAGRRSFLTGRRSVGSSFSSSKSSELSDPEELTSELGAWFTERAKYIPVRLTMEERLLLRLVQNVLRGHEYTDVVDGQEFASKMKRVKAQVGAIGAVLLGITASINYEKGQELADSNEFSEYAQLFQKVFEIGRRYKIMNPEKMRGTYGKLVFLLQDAMSPAIKGMLEFDAVGPIQTVFDTLKSIGAEAALSSPWIASATMEILPDGKSRKVIQQEIKTKERAIELISSQHGRSKKDKELIKSCLYSIGDNSSYLNSNCLPVDIMIQYLKQYFHPDNLEAGMSLEIRGGEDGSRLTHSHERQYQYCLQSLTLWREIVHDMFRLWYLAEQDLLDNEENPYKLRDTGQGLNRLQAAPRTSKAIHGILYAVQQRLGHTHEGWVGSSVIHLGDTNVPNSLVFIDKYNQVSRILNPLVQCLRQIDSYVAKDPGLSKYLDGGFGGPEEAKKMILLDFFRGAFDGSGADNFFEAGSCIDGRLTSAWNWCQSLSSKPFYRLFLLTGFSGFDGDFQT